jgi:hypothetical protein
MAANKIAKRPEDRNTHRPDIRDNLDSRKNEEQSFKGKDITHNKKETEGERKKKK